MSSCSSEKPVKTYGPSGDCTSEHRGYSADIPCAEVVEELLPTVGAHAYEVGGLLVGGYPLLRNQRQFSRQLGCPDTLRPENPTMTVHTKDQPVDMRTSSNPPR